MNLSANQIGERCSTLTQLESGVYDKYVFSGSSLQNILNCLCLAVGSLVGPVYCLNTDTICSDRADYSTRM
jgi:hypothetical protein